MEKYLYLLLNIMTISFPLIRSFEPKIQYAKKWHALLPAIAITAVFFLIWDYYFTIIGVWSFNPTYLTGLYIGPLPIEEWMFFITVPFACIFIYEVLNYFIEKDLLAKVSTPLTYILILAFLAIGLLHLDKWYTAVNFIIAAIMLAAHFKIYKNRFLGRFYMAYLVHLIPFLLVNGILTGSFIEEPVVLYNNAENLAIRIGTIPVEDIVYSMTLLLMNITLYEGFLKRKTNPLNKKAYA
ncbi:lycopene cyclase domain-containing protein [Anditalea andensis]|uniref:Membrane protein n=1 Tax=Anditalea andensis TaxID=1048983 RepID=A0A074KWZ9_9BACT|nr:lycopene cyclase domain-containing protein [Anditalea andensis]KEO73489.1 membrane protein [Anditalea andensis]